MQTLPEPGTDRQEKPNENMDLPERQALIAKRAMEIASAEGVPFADAALRAEAELADPEPDLPCDFTVTFTVKPRVAQWIRETFVATRDASTEQRIAAWLQVVISRARVEAMTMGREYPDIQKGEAVSIPGFAMAAKVPQ